jgi:uncharacterized protein (DUF58 family)
MTPRAALTVRGRVVLGTGATMALSAWLFGVQELYGLALAAFVLVAGARIFVGFKRWDLHVSRYVHPTRVASGQEARVELAIRNPTPSSSPPVDARDPFDGGKRWARFSVGPLYPGEMRTSSYRLPSTRRGMYRLGPLQLRLSDPFGLASNSRAPAGDTSLTVHPAYDLVPMVGLSAHRGEDRHLAQPVIGKGGSEFYALREYVPGDDLRHVHWPTTARVDDLVIRQPENLRRGRLTVLADLRASVNDDESLEVVLSAVASLAVSGLRSGLQVRVVTTAGFDSGHGVSSDHGPTLLDGLAMAVVHRDRPGVAPFRLAGGREPVVVITTDRCTAADLHSALGLSGPGATTLVVFETTPASAPTGGPDPGAPDWSAAPLGAPVLGLTVPVGRGQSFAGAWSRYGRRSALA